MAIARPESEARVSEKSDYITIDYVLTLADYEDRLVSMERGFTMDQAFLELWVPDDDPAKSIFYLFESASIRKLSGLSLAVAGSLLPSIDGEGLINELKTLGTVRAENTPSGLMLTVSFERKGGKSEYAEEIKGLSALQHCYRDRLVRNSRALKHQLPQAFFDIPSLSKDRLDLVQLEHEFGGGKLLVVFDRETSIVHEMGYHGLDTSYAQTRLIEILCGLVPGFTLQEVSEHGAIRVENFLRDVSQPPPVRGLISPETGKFFADINDVCRRIFASAREMYGYPILRNTSEEPVGSSWLSMDEKQRGDAILGVARAHFEREALGHCKVHFLGIRNEIQVYVDVTEYTGERERRMAVKTLERALKSELEHRIEVYLPTAEDKLKRDVRSGLVSQDNVKNATITRTDAQKRMNGKRA
jgi:hypothetical protein